MAKHIGRLRRPLSFFDAVLIRIWHRYSKWITRVRGVTLFHRLDYSGENANHSVSSLAVNRNRGPVERGPQAFLFVSRLDVELAHPRSS
jgi:hypothetical protein